ncbi:tachykinin-3b [Labrus bergylta]|uniref:tachykinin-3b n=1 Tax=Labrus bergylta TaxID=56723 RepID=UPI003314388D
MERSSNCSTLASLIALVILVIMPARTWCKEETYKSLTERKPECCVGEATELKRFDDIDYDSFVSLMGRRSAAQQNSDRNIQNTRKKNMDHILADLLGQKKRIPFPCAEEYLHKKGPFINEGR